MEKIKRIFQQIFLSSMGRIALGSIMFILGLIMAREGGTIGELVRDPYSESFDIWLCIGRIGGLLVFIQCLIYIIFGLIINPLKKK